MANKKINIHSIIINTSTIFSVVYCGFMSSSSQAKHFTSAEAAFDSIVMQASQHTDGLKNDQETMPIEAKHGPESQAAQSLPAKADPVPNRSSDDPETIVVTGSNIRGGIAAGANVEIFGRDDLNNSGYATVQDFLKTLPQNFEGGAGEDAASGALLNSNRLGGTAVNLRGLGADSTLVLINGRRTPTSGLDGNFTDISIIPQTAVERIEVLTDGASALYGSDAIGGVINFILRKDYTGAETRLRYGAVTEGQLDEYRLAQTVGQSWTAGHVIGSIEYYKRDNLYNSERKFAASNDLRPLGGGDYRIFASSPGNILNPRTFNPEYAIPIGQNGRSLQEEDLIFGQANLGNDLKGQDLLPKQKRLSGFVSGEQNISENWDVFFEIRASERKFNNTLRHFVRTLFVPASNPFYVNPYGTGPLYVAYSFENDLPAGEEKGRVLNQAYIGGARVRLDEWQVEGYGSLTRESSRHTSYNIINRALQAALADTDPVTAFNPFGDGGDNNPSTLAKLTGPSTTRPRSTVKNAKIIADGPLLSVAERDILSALGAEYRSDHFKRKTSLNDGTILKAKYHRRIYSAFGELYFPLVGPSQKIPNVNRLDISAAARIEKYSDIGRTTNPKIGISWNPFAELQINGTYGTSFRAPNLVEKDTVSNLSFITDIPDPTSSTGFSRAIALSGNDPNLKNEKADIITAGLTLKPEQLPGSAFKVSYFDIKYRDRIGSIPSLTNILLEEKIYSDYIVRSPDGKLLQQVCAESGFIDDPNECIPGLIGAIVDARTLNMAKNIVRGFDFSFSYYQDFNWGSYNIGLGGSHLIDWLYQNNNSSPKFELLDTLGNPISLKIRGFGGINYKSFNVNVILNYQKGYENTVSNVQHSISSFSTLDLSSEVDLGVLLFSGKKDVKLGVSIINVFNNSPPFVDNPAGIGYDPDNTDPLGRFISFEIRANF